MKNCNQLKKPFKPGEKEVNSFVHGMMQVAFKLIFFGSSKEDKEILQKAQKQIETNGPALCQEVGK